MQDFPTLCAWWSLWEPNSYCRSPMLNFLVYPFYQSATHSESTSLSHGAKRCPFMSVESLLKPVLFCFLLIFLISSNSIFTFICMFSACHVVHEGLTLSARTMLQPLKERLRVVTTWKDQHISIHKRFLTRRLNSKTLLSSFMLWVIWLETCFKPTKSSSYSLPPEWERFWLPCSTSSLKVDRNTKPIQASFFYCLLFGFQLPALNRRVSPYLLPS